MSHALGMIGMGVLIQTLGNSVESLVLPAVARKDSFLRRIPGAAVTTRKATEKGGHFLSSFCTFGSSLGDLPRHYLGSFVSGNCLIPAEWKEGQVDAQTEDQGHPLREWDVVVS